MERYVSTKIKCEPGGRFLRISDFIHFIQAILERGEIFVEIRGGIPAGSGFLMLYLMGGLP
jgi:hypothetical protein